MGQAKKDGKPELILKADLQYFCPIFIFLVSLCIYKAEIEFASLSYLNMIAKLLYPFAAMALVRRASGLSDSCYGPTVGGEVTNVKESGNFADVVEDGDGRKYFGEEVW